VDPQLSSHRKGLAIKEQGRWAGVHVQTFFVNYALPLDQTVHFIWRFLYSFYFLSSNKVYSVSLQQGCVSLQKFVMTGKTFMIFIFS